MYDIIGDIHGHADELTHLLDRMGYGLRHGVYRHPTRTAVFVGDFIDRGPKIREALRLVRSMIDEGGALSVMGNHEFNAISYHTPRPDHPDQYVRPHSSKNEKQHAETRKQLPRDELADYVEWFRTLPLWLDLDGVRIVHATWDPRQIQVLSDELAAHDGVTTAFVTRGNTVGDRLFLAIDDVLKGKEIALPNGRRLTDKDGHSRSKLRVKWYEPPVGQTYASYALPARDGLPDVTPDATAHSNACPYPESAPPVFFGHYWLRSTQPEPLGPNVACVDYSVAKQGMLCAYRWNGEQKLSSANFVTVSSNGTAKQ